MCTALAAEPTNSTRYVIKLADQGVVDAIAADKGLQHGLSVRHGQITEPAVADALGLPYTEPLDTLG